MKKTEYESDALKITRWICEAIIFSSLLFALAIGFRGCHVELAEAAEATMEGSISQDSLPPDYLVVHNPIDVPGLEISLDGVFHYSEDSAGGSAKLTLGPLFWEALLSDPERLKEFQEAMDAAPGEIKARREAAAYDAYLVRLEKAKADGTAVCFLHPSMWTSAGYAIEDQYGNVLQNYTPQVKVIAGVAQFGCDPEEDWYERCFPSREEAEKSGYVFVDEPVVDGAAK